ncbi:S-layer homology domain-containing protein [Candidatus Peregrinibacteria bacterium]|nr:S-layer homology domain-containing protein [Candidatus Peregrinibacteria bacterium]
MKKLILILSIFVFGTTLAAAEVLDTSNWYSYNGFSTVHSFSVRFPGDWQSTVLSSKTQGFYPTGKHDEDPYFYVQEFEGQTYSQVINYFVAQNLKHVSTKDLMFQAGNQDLLGKEVTYKNNETGEQFKKTLLKRGSLIVALSPNSADEEVKDILDSIRASFKFTDGWHQYLDLKGKYTFIFPADLKTLSVSNGITLIAEDKTIFSVLKYEDTPLKEAPESAEGSNESLLEEEEILFHGYNAIKARYSNTVEDKEFSRIFLEKNGDSYALIDVNLEKNYPRPDYYDSDIPEILESFEFFSLNLDEDYDSYTNFPDVRDNHPNAKAINSLVASKVINGYQDGKFRPDGEINRAELTKMIVASKVKPDPDKYKNCFPDVKEDWYAPYVCYAKEKKWVSGYSDKKFKPSNKINRAEAMKIIFNVLFSKELSDKEKLKDTSVLDVPDDAWFYKYFSFGDNNKLLDKQHITKDTKGYLFYPGDNITRKEVAEMIYRSKKL